MRLDKWLVTHNFVSSRAKAKELILKAAIQVNEKICKDVSYVVTDNDKLIVKSEEIDPYVSRSAHKLKAALQYFKIDIKNKLALDVGISTGGFTQVLLEQGAVEVFGIDVGHDQLHPSLKQDVRVKLFEGVNVKDVLPFKQKFEIIVVDISFISVTKVLKNLNLVLSDSGQMLILIKPQFEQTSEDKKKLVLSEIESRKIADQCRDAILKIGLTCSELFEVPLKGKDGNQEFFVRCSLA